MENQRPRWRFRISTLMLLVIIMARASALVSERMKLQRARVSAELARAQADFARAQAERALGIAQKAKAQLEARARSQRPPNETPARANDEGGR